MFIHNLNPIIFDFGILSLRWYSLAYLIGIIFGWWYGKKIILKIYKKDIKKKCKKKKPKTCYELYL